MNYYELTKKWENLKSKQNFNFKEFKLIKKIFSNLTYNFGNFGCTLFCYIPEEEKALFHSITRKAIAIKLYFEFLESREIKKQYFKTNKNFIVFSVDEILLIDKVFIKLRSKNFSVLKNGFSFAVYQFTPKEKQAIKSFLEKLKKTTIDLSMLKK